ncbi:MAG: hypothetical protein QM680_14330 [Luteolibacter sp.]
MALEELDRSDTVLLVVRGTDLQHELEALLREINVKGKRLAIAVTFSDKNPEEVSRLAAHYGKSLGVPLAQAGHLTVCKKQEMKLSKGDRLQLKANAQTAKGKRFINGELVTVKRVEKNGKIHLDDGRVLLPEYREFVRGYAVTSYASQGKTVDHVLFSDSSIKAATNAEQWYVTISRGRIGVRIFTTDKETLRENITRPQPSRPPPSLVTPTPETMKSKAKQESLPMDDPVDKWRVVRVGRGDQIEANQKWALRYENDVHDRASGVQGEKRLKTIAEFLNRRQLRPQQTCIADASSPSAALSKLSAKFNP